MAWITLQNVYDDVRYRTNTNSTSVADADLLRIANKRFREIYRHLVELDEDFYTEIQAYNLVADQRTYTLDADAATTPFGGGAIKVLRVEISFDNSKWSVAQPLSHRQIPTPTILEADITGQFDNSAPFYSILSSTAGRILKIYSGTIIAVTNGLRVFQVIRPVEMTAGTAVPDLPNDFLDTLSLGMSVDIFEKFGRNKEKNDTLAVYTLRLVQMREQEDDTLKEFRPILRPPPMSYK